MEDDPRERPAHAASHARPPRPVGTAMRALPPFLARLDPAKPENHKIIILTAALLSRVATSLIINLCTSWLRLPLFDASALVESSTPVLRWDAFHFTNVAARGGTPEWEHELAWGFGLPWVSSTLAVALSSVTGRSISYTDLAVLGSWAASVAGVLASLELYELTCDLTKATSFALLTSLLYCMPSSPPVVMYAPYTEPFFAFFAFHGMRSALNNNLLRATADIVIAQLFRSSGVLLWAFPLWYKLAEPALRSLVADIKATRRFKLLGPTTAYLLCICLAVVSLPLCVLAVEYGLQRWGKLHAFCSSTRMRPWCMNGEWTHWTSYAFVQEHYWNVGFLRYWEPAQTPNFLISAPVYALNFFYASTTIISGIKSYFGGPSAAFARPFLPFALHTLGYSLILFVSAHVQIMLRQVSGLPVAYWGAAALLSGQFGDGGRFWGKLWVGWSITWGVVSCILWATFLPPA
ncbi:glycosyltransferase family 76 protein [Calocera cornea HHB12733]|uniref:GPI mannosyltransferase 2 n=1 Tax=Calocera cornea HHB12733 TaxID=1353952 RepID=A0A165EJJ9_9BASI|nr:glycosyltransferase family 76 protein [Calocera cornea HHB12733]